MSLLTVPLAAFALIFVCHVALWRTSHPRRHITWVLGLFVLSPVPLLLACSYFLGHSWVEALLVLIAYMAIAGVYVQTYPAFQAYSPSLRVMQIIGASKRGLTLAELEAHFGALNINMERFDDLVHERFVESLDDGRVELQLKGKILAGIFLGYRRLLGLSPGKG